MCIDEYATIRLRSFVLNSKGRIKFLTMLEQIQKSKEFRSNGNKIKES
jgi:hypothetical protein